MPSTTPTTSGKPASPSTGEIKTIKVGPECWGDTLPLLLRLLESGTPDGRAFALKELQRMAELADRYVDLSK